MRIFLQIISLFCENLIQMFSGGGGGERGHTPMKRKSCLDNFVVVVVAVVVHGEGSSLQF